MKMKAIDPLTNKKFSKKRNNQKFATRKNQIKFNNLKARKKRQAIAGLNRILEKNRSIMKSLLANEKEVIKSYDFLLGAGFHFGCNTHTINSEHSIWSCVYEYGYCQLPDKRFKIIKTSNKQ
ncbi:hypothetical protein [Aquimarina addita]